MWPTGRQWWSVLGWLAFALALVVESIPLFRGESLGKTAGWTTLALYVFWGASAFLSGSVRRLQERMEDRDVASPPWLRGLGILLVMGALLLIATNLEALHKDVGLPFGVVLLVVILVGRLARPWILRLHGKQLRPEGAPARSEPTAGAKTAARPPMSRTQSAALVVGAVVLVLLVQGLLNPAPHIEGEEAEQALAELEELQETATRLGMNLHARALQLGKTAEADTAIVAQLRELSELAYAAAGTASAWKSRLQGGRVRVKDRARLQKKIQGIREDLDLARTGAAGDPP